MHRGLAVLALWLALVGCSLGGPGGSAAGPSPGGAGSVATAVPTAVPTLVPATPAPAVGSIAGDRLMYPSSTIPPLAIYAIDTAQPTHWYTVSTAQNQVAYTIAGMAAGSYYVVAYPVSAASPGLAGGYSRAVPCGLSASCTDHGLIAVTVRAGQAVTGIDPNDWYAPPGTFPVRPR